MSDIEMQGQNNNIKPTGPLDAFWEVVDQNPANPNVQAASFAMIRSTGSCMVHFARKLFGKEDAPQ